MKTRRSLTVSARFFSGAASKASASYYELLRVSQSASEDEIKKAYKKAALEHHPDRGGDPEKFKEISHAYSILSDPSKRQIYDQFGEAGLDRGSGPSSPSGQYEDPMDIFSQVFGGASRRNRQAGPARGRDALYQLELTLEEIATGTSRSIAYNRDVSCVNCGGRGATKIDPCRKCGGSGVILTRQNIGFLVHMQTACPDCQGQGFRVPKDGECKPCHGRGIVGQKEVFTVQVPKGAANGYEIRFRGKADQLPGHTAGDVVVQVKQKPHPVFTRMGNADLVMKKEISLADALAGPQFSVKSVRTEIVEIGASGVVSPGDVWVVRGQGLPRFDGSTNGDLFVSFSVKFPKSIDSLSQADRERIIGALDAKNKSAEVVVEGKTLRMEKIDSQDVKKKVEAALNPQSSRGQERAQSQWHSPDPQQCQQQ